MARPLRIQYPGAVYHVIGRGNARQPIVQVAADRSCFFEVLAKVIERRRWLCHAYCLMTNHYHLLLETPAGDLSRGMRDLNGIYTQRYNRRHDRVGHLFQGRFKAVLVQRDAHLLELARYIVLNPVAGGLVASAEEYRWSSYRAAVGLCPPPPWLFCEWILSQFGTNARERRSRYRTFVREGIVEGRARKRIRGSIVGDQGFIAAQRRHLEPRRMIREFSRRERFADRPPLIALLGECSRVAPEVRNRVVRRAHSEYAYSAAAIARVLDLHPSTISRIVSVRMHDSRPDP